ncbi:MAG: DUF1295 domain-containing protein [Pseudomonadota bacterium]
MRMTLMILFCLLAVTAFAFAGSDHGRALGGIPIFALCAAIAMAMQWLVFLPSWWKRSEHVFDLTGSATYILITLLALVLSGNRDPRSVLLTVLVLLWALRLGSFLFFRVQHHGDGRFDTIKQNPVHFLLAFTLQGLWVILTAGAALAAITTDRPQAAGPLLVVGLAFWLVGFMLEVVADEQKRRFRLDPANEGRFIRGGLWAWSRHPNYFGEILLWTGMAMIALPVLQGWQWLTLVSPLFVAWLLTRVSGIPMLERRAEKRWGDDPEYRKWKAGTPVLVPRPPWLRGVR